MSLRCCLVLFAACICISTADAQAPAKPRVDSLGDALPDGAIARLGTLRMRHPDAITQSGFSADGKKAFALDHGSRHVKVWDLTTGKQLGRIAQLEQEVLLGFHLSSDRTVMAAIGSENIQVLNTLSNTKIGQFAWGTRQSAVSLKDNKTLVHLDAKGAMDVWDIPTGMFVSTRDLLANIQKPKEIEFALDHLWGWKFSPDARILIAHFGKPEFVPRFGPHHIAGRVVVAWDTSTGKELWRQVGNKTATSFEFSPDGKSFAQIVDGEDAAGELQYCDAETGKIKALLPLDKIAPRPRLVRFKDGLIETIHVGAIAPDCKTIAIRRADGRVLLWDPIGKQQIKEIALHIGSSEVNIPHLDFSPDGKFLLAALHNTLQLIDLATGKQVLPWEGHREPVSYLHFAADGLSLTTGSGPITRYQRAAYDVLTWNISAGKQTKSSNVRELEKLFKLQAISPDHTIGLGSKGDGFAFHDLKSGKMLSQLQAEVNDRKVSSGTFSPRGRYFVLPGEFKQTSAIIDATTGRELFELPKNGLPDSVAFSADEGLCACQTQTGLIHVVTTATGKPISNIGRAMRSHFFAPYPLAFSPDAKSLASWDSDTNDVVIWTLDDSKSPMRLSGKKIDGYRPRIIFFWSPDGRMFAEVGGESGDVIRIWEVSSGKLRKRLTGHQGKINALAWSSDGRHLASGSDDTTVLIWDM